MCFCNCCGTPVFTPNETEGQGPEVMVAATKLGMRHEDLNKLYAKFCSYDVDNDHRVDLDELVVVTALTCEELLKLIFRLFDRDMYNFIALDKDDLAAFCFSIFDIDGSGYINSEELQLLCSITWIRRKHDNKGKWIQDMVGHGENAATEYLSKCLDSNRDGKITCKEFMETSKHASSLLFPVFQAQAHLAHGIFTKDRLKEIVKYRHKLMKGRRGYMGFENERKEHLNFINLDSISHARIREQHEYALVGLQHSSIKLHVPGAISEKVKIGHEKLESRKAARGIKGHSRGCGPGGNNIFKKGNKNGIGGQIHPEDRSTEGEEMEDRGGQNHSAHTKHHHTNHEITEQEKKAERYAESAAQELEEAGFIEQEAGEGHKEYFHPEEPKKTLHLSHAINDLQHHDHTKYLDKNVSPNGDWLTGGDSNISSLAGKLIVERDEYTHHELKDTKHEHHGQHTRHDMTHGVIKGIGHSDSLANHHELISNLEIDNDEREKEDKHKQKGQTHLSHALKNHHEHNNSFHHGHHDHHGHGGAGATL